MTEPRHAGPGPVTRAALSRLGSLRALAQAAAPLPLALCGAVIVLALTAFPAGASPGSAYLVLTPALASGSFDADAYCADPAGFASRATEHPDGWTVAYRHADPPAGWSRPFVIRGGGPGSDAGTTHPHLAYAIEEMLPVRNRAVLALRETPDPEACYPGKPHPQPFFRSGYLFLHDGRIDIEPVTNEIWLRSGDPEWDAFKLAHPRDYNGNDDPVLGNASEIYFLALLYEISLTPEDVTGAFVRTLNRMRGVPGYDTWQLNALLQSAGDTWVLRHALAASQDGYEVYYGLTTQGEYCITDELPSGAAGWSELPNFTLACFPASGEPELVSMLSSGATETPAPPFAQLTLHPARCPAVGRVALSYRTPWRSGGRLELYDLQDRLLASWSVTPGSGMAEWTPPPTFGDGLLWARLRWNGLEAHRRILFLR